MAATIQVIAPATASKANSTNSFDSAPFARLVVSAPGLATTEEVDIYTKTAGGYSLFGQTGTVWKLTASIQAIELPPGPVYAFAKDATAAAVGVFVSVSGAGV